MTSPHVWAFGSALGVSLVSLVGLAMLPLGRGRHRDITPSLLALAAGALLGNAGVQLLPEAFAASRSLVGPLAAFTASLLGFAALDGAIHFVSQRGSYGIHSVGYINLLTDAVHNLVDGVAMAVAYSVDLELGVATTLAVLAHEVPTELGDFAILLDAGFSRRRALLLNLVSGFAAIAGVALAWLLGQRVQSFATAALPIVAGGFVYIAVTHLLPKLLRRRVPLDLAFLGAGLLLMLVL